jgi:peptidoglycan hydrolase-like protein with peptidoglycan-binding domain
MIKKISIVAFTLLLGAPFVAQAATLTRQLDLGMQGSDVGTLQTYLATDSTIYPQGLVTNYFGSLTASAVSNFQSKNGLATVGRVGPATLLVLNNKMSGIVTPTPTTGALTRQLDLGMQGSDVGMLQTYLATDATIYPQGLVTNYFGSLTASAVSNFQSKNGLATVGRVGPETLALLNTKMTGNATTDIDASIISSINVSTSYNTASISWNTNELAKGVIYYSSSPLTTYERENSVDVSGNTAMTDTTMRTYQSISLSNLESNTVYYYMIYTTDQSGNVSVSIPLTFRTN